MELILNDCSIHGQFQSLGAFRDAIGRVMTIRETARRFSRDLQCHRNVANAQVTPELRMREAAPRALDKNKLRAFMGWLDRYGPFWDDFRQHSADDDLLEYNGEMVTDTAVGEAAYCLVHGIDRGLVSLTPSSWQISPLSVNWHDNGHVRSVEVLNYWDPDELEAALESASVPPGSWNDLETVARSKCPDLTFADDSFYPLEGHPFGKGAAQQVLSRLNVLQDLKNCFDEHGRRTPKGHMLYRTHFTGDNAWFSDSSDTEKSEFRADLTFSNPTRAEESLFCTWHGKVRRLQLRIHFSWPLRANEPLYIVYVGPKITKR